TPRRHRPRRTPAPRHRRASPVSWRRRAASAGTVGAALASRGTCSRSTSTCSRWSGRRTRRRPLLAGRHEDRDLPVGALLVLGVRRVGGDGPLPPGGLLVAGDLTDPSLEELVTVLDDDLVGVGLE